MTVTARDVALAALGRVDEGAWANLALPGLLNRSGLGPGDRAAVTDLVSGTLRLRAALDTALAPLSRQPIARLEPLVRNGLRLGAYELLFAGTAPHAALNEVVGSVRRAGRQGQAGYVNAVLRRLAATEPRWPDPAADPVGWATTRGSHPAWVVEEALARIGPRELVALVEADNARPAVTLRATPGRTTRDELLRELDAAGVPAGPSVLSPDCVELARGDPRELAAVLDGRAVVQDAASALVAPALGVGPGALVVDLAAGPGGKAGHLAALGARVLAVELHPARARLVRETADRLGSETQARLLALVGDGTQPPVAAGRADGVLVDAPCTNLGSLRRRPEARWRHQPGEVEDLAALQLQLLEAAADAVRPGGAVVYSVCTWTRAETDAVVDALLERRPDLDPAPLAGPAGPGARRQLWPHREGADGVFLARLVKIA
ncbi:MAG TPA: transcription antitermination factor NusB [Actinomycetes bacterium]|nr:transcription antitermination factor NusB [Actinomycetes bacterium]